VLSELWTRAFQRGCSANVVSGLVRGRLKNGTHSHTQARAKLPKKRRRVLPVECVRPKTAAPGLSTPLVGRHNAGSKQNAAAAAAAAGFIHPSTAQHQHGASTVVAR